jgi:hypothetical protein
MNQRPDADDIPHREWKCEMCGKEIPNVVKE